MANFGSTAFYLRCANTVSGINAKSYTANTSCEYKKTQDACGENVQGFTKNVMSKHDWEGEITGGSAGGVVVYTVGSSVSAPNGGWTTNMGTPGSVFVCTEALYTETAGEWAKFRFSAENNDGI